MNGGSLSTNREHTAISFETGAGDHMQRAEGTRGDAPPDGRGLDSGEELRPPKKAGKDQLTVHGNPPFTDGGTKKERWNSAAVYQRLIMLSRHFYQLVGSHQEITGKVLVSRGRQAFASSGGGIGASRGRTIGGFALVYSPAGGSRGGVVGLSHPSSWRPWRPPRDGALRYRRAGEGDDVMVSTGW